MRKRIPTLLTALIVSSLSCNFLTPPQPSFGRPTSTAPQPHFESPPSTPSQHYPTSTPPALPPGPVTSVTPLASGQISAHAGALVDTKPTDVDGHATIEDAHAGVLVRVRVEDAQDRRPLPHVLVHWMSYAGQFVIIAVDPQGAYLPATQSGMLAELTQTVGGDHSISLGSVPPRQAWDLVELVLSLMGGIEDINSLSGLAQYIADWPDIVANAGFEGWYTEYCLTGEQMVNLFSASGLLIPGAGSIAAQGPELILATGLAISMHILEQDAETYIISMEGRHRLRFYISPFPWLFFTYNGSCDGPVGTGPTSSLNGRIAFVSSRDGNWDIFTMDPDGGNVTNLTNSPSTDADPSWSRDGTKIAFTVTVPGEQDIYTMMSDGSQQQHLAFPQSSELDPTWSPDGEIAFSRAVWGSGIHDIRNEVYAVHTDGTGLVNLTNRPTPDSSPHWSPDGKRIVFTSARDGNWEIYVMDSDGTNQLRLTRTQADEFEPKWSPDGSMITFVSERDGNYEIYIMRSDGSDLLRLTDDPARDFFPAWSPDGTEIAFASWRDGNVEIYVVNADGTGLTNLTNNPADDFDPDWAVGTDSAIPN